MENERTFKHIKSSYFTSSYVFPRYYSDHAFLILSLGVFNHILQSSIESEVSFVIFFGSIIPLYTPLLPHPSSPYSSLLRFSICNILSGTHKSVILKAFLISQISASPVGIILFYILVLPKPT